MRATWQAGRWSGVLALLTTIALALSIGLACWARDAGGTVHPRGDVMQEAVVALTRALLRQDPESSRRHFDRLSGLVKRIGPDEREEYGADISGLARAYHLTVDRGRGSSSAGDLDEAFNEFVWTQRTCVKCHELARDQGLLPAEGPLWSAPE